MTANTKRVDLLKYCSRWVSASRGSGAGRVSGRCFLSVVTDADSSNTTFSAAGTDWCEPKMDLPRQSKPVKPVLTSQPRSDPPSGPSAEPDVHV